MVRTILLLKWKSLKSQSQYPVNFLIQVVGISLTDFGIVAGILVITNAFHLIGGWTFWQVAFMNAIFQLAHGLHHIFFLSFWWHGSLVRQGTYDRLLVRPIHPVIQILAQDLPLPALGELLPGVIMLLITAPRVSVVWSPSAIAFLVLVVVSGAIIEWSFFLFRAGFDFWFVEASNFSHVIAFTLFYVPRYPMHIYGRAILLVLTFVLPSAFIAYYPAQSFLGITPGLPIPFLVYASPIASLIAFTVAILFWSLGLRHYESTGS